MCKWVKSGNQRIDPCMRVVIANLRKAGATPLGCCCGHGKYPKTIVMKTIEDKRVEYYTGRYIPRTTRFYKRDSDGVFFIPEIQKSR
jgi:hypothetical protein